MTSGCAGPPAVHRLGPDTPARPGPAARPLADNTPHSDSQQQPTHRELRERGTRHPAVQHRGRGLELHRITAGPGLREFTTLFGFLCIYSLHVQCPVFLNPQVLGSDIRYSGCDWRHGGDTAVDCSRQITLLQPAHRPLHCSTAAADCNV